MTAAPAPAITTDRRYVFLASHAYSGSTLLSYLLGAHPDVATISDVSGTRRSDRMDDFQCSCGTLMRECGFWQELGRRAVARGMTDFELGDFRAGFDHAVPAALRPIGARTLRWSWLERARDSALGPFGMAGAMGEAGRRSWALAEAVLDMAGARVFVDASKERLRIRNLERYLPAEVLVIHLVRDVRGVVESTLRRGKVALDAPAAARRWARTNATILRQLSEIPASRALTLRYEDLCADVDRTLRRAFDFIGVDSNASLQAFSGMHVLGNRMRIEGLGAITLDERWRDALDADTQRSVMAAAEPTFSQLYPEHREEETS